MFVFTSMTPSNLTNQILLDSEFLYLNYENFMVTFHAVSVASSRRIPKYWMFLLLDTSVSWSLLDLHTEDLNYFKSLYSVPSVQLYHLCLLYIVL